MIEQGNVLSLQKTTGLQAQISTQVKEHSPQGSTIRVLVADDQAIVRRGICALLSTESHVEVVGTARDGAEALRMAQEFQPDVVLMDLVMPGMDGLEATRRITAALPNVRVLVLTSFANDDKVFPAIRAGAAGYLLKDSDPEDLAAAIRQVHKGESSLHPLIARKVLHKLTYPSATNSDTDGLTEREVEVLRLVAQGYSNREIADALTISAATVRTHVSNILSKLSLCSRTQAALYAIREGLAPLEAVIESQPA